MKILNQFAQWIYISKCSNACLCLDKWLKWFGEPVLSVIDLQQASIFDQLQSWTSFCIIIYYFRAYLFYWISSDMFISYPLFKVRRDLIIVRRSYIMCLLPSISLLINGNIVVQSSILFGMFNGIYKATISFCWQTQK